MLATCAIAVGRVRPDPPLPIDESRWLVVLDQLSVSPRRETDGFKNALPGMPYTWQSGGPRFVNTRQMGYCSVRRRRPVA